MTHRARAPDGLDANLLNLSDGGKNTKLTRPGWYMSQNADGSVTRVEQPMQTAAGIQKGLKTILVERGKFMDSGGGPLRKIHSRKNCWKFPYSKMLRSQSAFRRA